MVRDRHTKKPLAGVTVRSDSRATGPGSFQILDTVRTTTDAEGRYRLTGMAKGEGYKIAADPTHDQPYVSMSRDVPEHAGLDPVTVDFEIKRGVWIEGKITDDSSVDITAGKGGLVITPAAKKAKEGKPSKGAAA